ncbi:unnamed protein product [Rotaria sp. Silwood1]|nr:unnamed protein product [Rotaria sp. Silwood1]
MNRVSNMPQQYRIFRDRFERVVRGTSAEPPRTILCGQYVNGNMGFAVSKLYIKRYFDSNARNQSFDMINNIQAAFIDMLNQTNWMDVESMNKAIEKRGSIDQAFSPIQHSKNSLFETSRPLSLWTGCYPEKQLMHGVVPHTNYKYRFRDWGSDWS